MPVIKIFLDTPILREAFIKEVNGSDWRQGYKLPTNMHLITAHKCLAEMYGILKTSILENELASYGLVSSIHLRDMLFSGDNFLIVSSSEQKGRLQIRLAVESHRQAA